MKDKTLPDPFLREMTPSDCAAINALARRCPDGGAVSVVSVFRENAFESLGKLRPDSLGIAAESTHHEGLAGMGWVSFRQAAHSQARINDWKIIGKVKKCAHFRA